MKKLTPRMANRLIIIIEIRDRLKIPGSAFMRDWTAILRPGFF